MSSNILDSSVSSPCLPNGAPHHNKTPTKIGADIAIEVINLSKSYQIYTHPQDRLKQSIYSRLSRLFGRPCAKYFHDFWALKNISFKVEQGETVGIVGQNGSGKSTLLQIICGTLTASGGTVNTYGRIAALLELGAGFNTEFTGRENVYLNGAILGLNKEEIASRFDQIASFADIGEYIEQPVKTYSSGMLVRLAFAVAINVDPQLLIIDEALSVGDELFQRKCFSRIEAIKKKGATILFVSHSGGAIIELCDNAILLDAGEMIARGGAKHIVGTYQKLIYAPKERRAKIRDEIYASKDNWLADFTTHPNSQGPVRLIKNERDAICIKDDFFDSNLKPQSTLEYECHGACISSPEILTLSGERVNCLTRGKNYRYRYKVKFDQCVTNVRFGMLIKTTSGLELGGAVSAPKVEQGIPSVPPGTTVWVEFRFSCKLNPGTYFLNAGVTGTLCEEETFLHRVLDIFMFRVMPVSDNTATAIVDFDCSAEIQCVQ